MSQDNGGGITLHGNGEDFAMETATGFVPKIDPAIMRPTSEAQRFIDEDVAVESTSGFVPRPLRAAELSSQQRNALVDSLVSAVNNHAKVLAEHRQRIEQAQVLANQQLELRAYVERHFGILTAIDQRVTKRVTKFVDRTFWQRLRWLVTGR